MILNPNKKDGTLGVHRLISAYDTPNRELPMSRWVSNGLLRYRNEKNPRPRGSEWRQLPAVYTHLGRASDQNILTDSDLVKYKKSPQRQASVDDLSESRQASLSPTEQQDLNRIVTRMQPSPRVGQQFEGLKDDPVEARRMIGRVRASRPDLLRDDMSESRRATGPLADMYMHARTLRLADGADEVHRMVVARAELKWCNT